MPIFRAHKISTKFDNGNQLFQNLSFSMNKQRVGLVGRNGSGKSLLASIIHGDTVPSSGHIECLNSIDLYRQNSSPRHYNHLTLSEFIGKDALLNAIRKVEAGEYADSLFELINEQWHYPAKLSQQLSEHGLPCDFNFPCEKLSGGQLARLQLWQLFEKKSDLLILDEPSNHLDEQAKQWLIESIDRFPGAILLISHDRKLLNMMEEIWEISSLGLNIFGGNYDKYAKQKQFESAALDRQLSCIERQKKQIDKQEQLNKEKAERRASQSNTLRRSASQAKTLLDFKKDKASSNASNRTKSTQLRQNYLIKKAHSLKEKYEHITNQTISLGEHNTQTHLVISLLNAVLPFGCKKPQTLQIYANEKVHIRGPNGSGKTTLLKTLLGTCSLNDGDLNVSISLFYLDQHFGLIDPDLTLVENILKHCTGMTETEARTLLAGINFRRDTVFQQAKYLSGGEKMKLSILIVSHQSTQPLLLLDEPDNHLDLESKIILAKALKAYKGGYLLVTHDHIFSDEAGVTRNVYLS